VVTTIKAYSHQVSRRFHTPSVERTHWLAAVVRPAQIGPETAIRAADTIFRLADNHERSVICRPNQQIAKCSLDLFDGAPWKASMLRREFLRIGALTLLSQAWLVRDARAAGLPTEVAGVRLPHSALALRAADFVRTSYPDFLFNHCMRTYLFGALMLNRQKRAYRADDAFVAAMFHDSGLLAAFETPKGSFEVDGADAAERWVRDNGGSKAQATRVWYAVEMHDGDSALPLRQGPEALLVALGAGADVDGPDPGDIDKRQIEDVLAAFPRLNFKRRFPELLVGHCLRKPESQSATWLESLCREHSPHAFPHDAVEQEIANAPFSE
jgi:hypothetical protein